MTNLLEKALITGFGIFALTMFIVLIAPMLDHLDKFELENSGDLRDVSVLIDEIDDGIEQVSTNPEEMYGSSIYYPPNLKIIIEGNHVRYDFKIDGKEHSEIRYYELELSSRTYEYLKPTSYILKIFSHKGLICLEFEEDNT